MAKKQARRILGLNHESGIERSDMRADKANAKKAGLRLPKQASKGLRGKLQLSFAGAPHHLHLPYPFLLPFLLLERGQDEGDDLRLLLRLV